VKGCRNSLYKTTQECLIKEEGEKSCYTVKKALGEIVLRHSNKTWEGN